MKRLLLVLMLFGVPACTPPPNLTPQAQVAFTADQIVQRVNELENAAIAANGSGALSTDTTRLIVDFCVTADKTLKSAPLGWQKAVGDAWASLKKQIPAPSQTLQAVMTTLDAALSAVGVNP